MFGVNDTGISADQSAHAAAPDTGMAAVGERTIMRIDKGLERADQKLCITLALTFTKFAVEIGAILLYALAATVVNSNHNEVANSRLGHLGQVPVDRPVAKGCAIIKEILRIL